VNAEQRRTLFQSSTLPCLDRLFRLASRWAIGPDAEDDVQETYIRAWAAFDQLRDADAVFPWLCRILRTVALERHRTRARRQDLAFVVEMDAAHEDAVASEAPSPLDDLLAQAERRRLTVALHSIPEEFAEAVELHDVHGLKYREIAQITNSPIGTVMSRISRGRKLLAALLDAADDASTRRKVAT
jgi:RNA polymerase sigma-70 factor, ECF subfamily